MDLTLCILLVFAILMKIWHVYFLTQIGAQTGTEKPRSKFSILHLLLLTAFIAFGTRLAINVMAADDVSRERSRLESKCKVTRERLAFEQELYAPKFAEAEADAKSAEVLSKAIKDAIPALEGQFSQIVERISKTAAKNPTEIGIARLPVAEKSSMDHYEIAEFCIFVPDDMALTLQPSLLDRDGGPLEDVRQDSLFKEYFEFQWTTKDRRAPVFQSGISKVRWMTLTVENERNLLCFVDEEQVGKVIVSNKGEDYQSFTKDLAIGESKTAGQNDSLTLIDIDMPLGKKKELYFITLRMQLTVIDD